MEHYVYIDETGDRGHGPTSSPIFGMAAVIVSPESAVGLRAAVTHLQQAFGVPATKVMSWKEHVKTHDRRRYAAQVLRDTAGVTVCYVFTQKARLRADSYKVDRGRFYNYVAGKTLKSVLWAARHLGSTDVHVRFGHVRHHDHRTTEVYLKEKILPDPKVPDSLVRSLRWVSADQYLESQAADLYGGFLKAAIWPDGQFQMTEGAYLRTIWSQLRGSDDCAIPLGIMSMPDYAPILDAEWFPCTACKQRQRAPEPPAGQSN